MRSSRDLERLRQERETFDQLKCHDALWFRLRLTAGFTAILALLVVLLGATGVVLSPARYGQGAVLFAAVAILADIAGLAGTVFLLLLLRDGSGHLRPIVRKGRE